MAYAVIRSGGKQYKVTPGQLIKLPSLPGEVGSEVEFGEVLHLGGDDDNSSKAGSPLVSGAKVVAKIVRQGRDKKVLVYKFKRRKGFEKLRGHRQGFTEVLIGKVEA